MLSIYFFADESWQIPHFKETRVECSTSPLEPHYLLPFSFGSFPGCRLLQVKGTGGERSFYAFVVTFFPRKEQLMSTVTAGLTAQQSFTRANLTHPNSSNRAKRWLTVTKLVCAR